MNPISPNDFPQTLRGHTAVKGKVEPEESAAYVFTEYFKLEKRTNGLFQTGPHSPFQDTVFQKGPHSPFQDTVFRGNALFVQTSDPTTFFLTSLRVGHFEQLAVEVSALALTSPMYLDLMPKAKGQGMFVGVRNRSKRTQHMVITVFGTFVDLP